MAKKGQKRVSSLRMAKFLKSTTKLAGRNEIKDHVKNMGIDLNVGELEEIYYRMLELSTDDSDAETENEPGTKDATVKTEPDAPESVI